MTHTCCSTLAALACRPSRRLWHRRCLQVSARESVYSFPAWHHTLCTEQIRALTWGMCLGVGILFFSPERASGQIGAWIRRGTLYVSSRIALSAAFSGSEYQTTKLARDREISQSKETFFFLSLYICPERNLCPPENLGLVFTAV